MADGDENGARKKMQEATAKFLERRNREHETVDTEHGRIVMPSLSNKWQTIIDDTLIPQLQQNKDSAVRKRSGSITPEDEEVRKPRPLSMPNVASPLSFEIYDDASNQEEPPLEVEMSLQAGGYDDQPGRSQRSRQPAKLNPIDHLPDPPSYSEALKINGARELPQSLPVYGRLWQKSRQWSREAGNHDPQFEPKVPTSEDIIEPNSASASFTSGRPLPPIAKSDSIDGLSQKFFKETRFTDIDAIPERQQSYRAATSNWILQPHPSVTEEKATTRTEFDVEEGRAEERKRFECANCFGDRFPRVVRYLNSLTLQKFLILVTIATVIIGLILFVGIFPASFVYVEYHEMALLKNKVTGTVDRDTVYFTGCYVLGPDKEFIRYPKYGNTISMTTDVFTIDKLEITMSFHLQYYIRSNELGDLHRQYEQDYNGVLRNVARSEIKNHVGQFSLDYFRLNRTNLEKYILNLLQARFEGDCCKSCCPSSCTNNTVCATCLPADKCHPGYHVDIKYFQLTQISIPSEVSNLFVQQLVLQVEAEKEFLVQTHSLVQKETEQLTKKLKNEANEILEEAQANSSKKITLAEADREVSLTSAYVHGLKYLYLTLGVNNEEHQLSLMMIRALEDSNVKGNLYRGYGYNTSTIKETRFTDIDAIPERQQSYRAATSNWILQPHPSVTEEKATRTEFDVEEGRAEERKRFECANCFGDRFPRVVRYLNSLTLQKFLILVTIATVIIGLILFVGIFPASFVYVEYHEMALLKNKVTGTVDRDTVYFTGCYVLGPDKEFIRYPKYGNTISMTTDVFTIDKLEITMSFHLQYYIRSSELGDLHRQYEQDYNGVLRNVARSEIKNHVGQFSLDYFRLNRTNLEKYILNLLQARFVGDCCKSCCPSSCTNNTVCATCLPADKCHPGYHVDIKYFQLTQISIPSEVSNLFVQQLVLQVEAEKEFLVQTHSLVQKETEKLTKKLKNEANEILEEAQANSSKKITLAEADREVSLTSAYVHGLKYLYLTLGVNSEEHQLSLMMIRALEDSNVKGNLYRGYGYNTSTIVSSPFN